MVYKFNPLTNRLDITGTSGGGGGGIDSLTGNTGGAIGPDGSGNVNIIGSGNISVSGSGSTLTITSASSFFAWFVITANQTANTFEGYFVNGGSRVDITLPATSSVGDTFIVVDKGGNLWRILQAAGQTIRFKDSVTSTGVGGSLTSQVRGDAATFVCAVANTEWWVTDSIGTMVVV
jgi:hypothetical protein